MSSTCDTIWHTWRWQVLWAILERQNCSEAVNGRSTGNHRDWVSECTGLDQLPISPDHTSSQNCNKHSFSKVAAKEAMGRSSRVAPAHMKPVLFNRLWTMYDAIPDLHNRLITSPLMMRRWLNCSVTPTTFSALRQLVQYSFFSLHLIVYRQE